MPLTRKVVAMFAVAVILTIALYWPGLRGPYLFDDFWNLAPIERWINGQESWQTTLLPSPSIIFSRPVSVATFMGTMWIGGLGPFASKLGNLVIHVLCGGFAWWLLLRTMEKDDSLRSHSSLAATCAVTIWLIHPLHVSTVLYAIQRMAQLSTLFTLAATILYVVARTELDRGAVRSALLKLFVFFPILLATGLLSKQNAAVTPLLCLVLEFAYFQRNASNSAIVKWFFTMFLAIPSTFLIAILAIRPERLLSAYNDLDFSWKERLLTQPAVLSDYIGMWLLPRTPRMGLYTDDFPVSTGLLDSPETLFGIILIGVISIGSFIARKRAPSVFAGWFFFLAAHSIESSFLPLELYYEHRNYLPSIGLLLAAFGLIGFLSSRVLSAGRDGSRGRLLLLFIAISCVLSFATLGRVLVWQHNESIVEQGYRQHPDSLRATIAYMTQLLEKRNFAGAIEVWQERVDSTAPRTRLIARVNTVILKCMSGAVVTTRQLQGAVGTGRPKLSVYEVQVAWQMLNVDEKLGCDGVSSKDMADSLNELLIAANTQPESSANKAAVRRTAAQLYARAGLIVKAEEQADIAWRGAGDLPTGAFLVRLLVQNGKHDSAAVVMRDLERRIRSFDRGGQAELTNLRTLLGHRATN